MYQFEAIAGRTYGFDIDTPIGTLDAVLRIFDSSGTELAEDDLSVGPAPEFGSLEAYIEFTAPTDGTFFVGVSGWDSTTYDPVSGANQDAFNSQDPYELVFRQFPVFAVDDGVGTPENQSVTISVLDNDTPTGDVMVIGNTDPSSGSVVDNGDGTLTYTPNSGFTGSDSFDYTIALQDVELISSNASTGDRFGRSVDVDGDFAVVGAYLEDSGGLTNSGAAYVYQRIGATSWVQVAELTGDLNGDDAQSYFGWDVAIDGETVVVSAQFDRDNGFRSGAAYVFERNEGGADNWGRVTKFAGSDTDNSDFFGRSIDIDGDTIVVGASISGSLGAASGAAYVFERNEGGANAWGQTQKLLGSTQAAGDRFGQSVAVDGDTIAVGAFRNDFAGADAGAVFVFGRDIGGSGNWGEAQAVYSDSAANQDFFGFSVDLSGDQLAIGAPQDDEPGKNQTGAVYVMERDAGGAGNWGQVDRLLATGSVAGDRLGWSVGIDGNRIVSGAVQADVGGDRSGSAILFENDGSSWLQTRELVNSKVTTADEYGVAIAVQGDVAVVGSWLDNRPNNNSGGAYAFDLNTDTATVDVSVTSSAAPSNSVAVDGSSKKDANADGWLDLFEDNGSTEVLPTRVIDAELFHASESDSGSPIGYEIALAELFGNRRDDATLIQDAESISAETNELENDWLDDIVSELV